MAFMIIRLLLNKMHKYSITNAVLARNNQPLTAKACYPPEIIVKHSITNPTKMHYFSVFSLASAFRMLYYVGGVTGCISKYPLVSHRKILQI